MHNSVIVSCFTRDLQYCLYVEYKIKDKMQVGYNGTECPIKELCSNLQPILRHRHYYKEIRQPTCSTMILISSYPRLRFTYLTMIQLDEISICDNCDAIYCSISLHLGDIFLGQIIDIL